MSSNSNNEAASLVELVEKINQFFAHQIESNNDLSDAAKESLSVASECIEQAYKIQRKPASRDLLDIYKSHNQQSSGQGGPNFSATLVQNLANTILSQATAGLTSRSNSASTGAAPSAPTQSSQQTAARPPKTRNQVSEAEKMAAESFKNQGNDAMKQDNYQLAYDYYTQAINIDNNNAIYYSNRAAASSKLGEHQSALNDCLEAIEIDPNYSKAYGRMGLAYASMDNHQQARDSYKKAVELDPNNESYKNNLKIAEEKLGEEQGSGAGNAGMGGNDMMSMIRNMMSNPQVMQMAMRSLQDPRMQSLFSAGVAAATAAAGSTNNDPHQPPPTGN